jgi:hypothetical protein
MENKPVGSTLSSCFRELQQNIKLSKSLGSIVSSCTLRLFVERTLRQPYTRHLHPHQPRPPFNNNASTGTQPLKFATQIQSGN